MATEATQPMAEVIAPQEASLDVAGEIPSVLSKDTETSRPPAEDRLSLSASPEPCAEGGTPIEGSAKAAGASVSESNGVTTMAAGVIENKPVVKTKKKEDKSIEYILRALSSLNSPEEKLAALCKKYADLHEEHRVLQSSFKQQQRKMTVGQREKDQLQAEHTKAVIAKSKLESLCRELQKQNKAVKEESILRQRQEEERRKEISAKFQTTIGEIQTQMTENHEKNVKLREENHDLACKLKKFLEQQDLREQQLEKLTKHRELENQLSEAKLAQAAAIMKEHDERNTQSRELLLLQTAEAQKKNTLLEAQLNMYKDRYEEFQGTINKSNDMFQKLKSEMDKMGKRIKKLEKEGAQWRAKWEASNKSLLDMAEEKTRADKEKQVLQSKIVKLESLCRALQGEMHGKKSSSPHPVPSGDSSRTSVAPAIAASVNAPASATTTPPNTPEESTSRASPNPESPANLAHTLPSGQNGPISASSVPEPSPETVSEAPAVLSPAAPAEVSPAAPAEVSPAAPAEVCPAVPAEESPAAPEEESPAAPAEENATSAVSETASACQCQENVCVPDAAAPECDQPDSSPPTSDLPVTQEQAA